MAWDCTAESVTMQKGSITEPATAQMNHKRAHQTAYHQHSVSYPRPKSNPPVRRCPEFTRERCVGFQKGDSDGERVARVSATATRTW